jgi:hypothetical protein
MPQILGDHSFARAAAIFEDGADDGFGSRVWDIGALGLVDGQTQETEDGGILEIGRFADFDVAESLAGALEDALRVVERSAVMESEIDAGGEGGDVDKGIARAAGEGITGGDGGVSVVEELDGIGGFFEHDGSNGEREIDDVGRERGEEVEVGGIGRAGH